MYTNPDQMFNAIRFGQKFEEKVANPSDIILLKKRHELMEKRDVLAGDTMKKILSRGVISLYIPTNLLSLISLSNG